MENTALHIEQTSKTPGINCDADKGIVVIKGRSVPENAVEFFTPVKDWISNYVSNPQDLTEVSIDLDYFNTSTSIILLNLLRLFEPLKGAKKDIIFNWYYESDDLDMKEAGEEYQLMLGQALTLKAKNSPTS